MLIEDTVSAVKEGLDLSQETNQALQTVVESSQKVLEATPESLCVTSPEKPLFSKRRAL